MKNETLVVYFDDPLLPYFVKDLIRRPENKAILRMYERGLPSWAVFLPSYGLPYRYWMRKVMTFLIFIVTVTSMLLGFYDLYKNIPALREFLYNVFGNVFIYFEDAVAIRLSVLLGYLVARS